MVMIIKDTAFGYKCVDCADFLIRLRNLLEEVVLLLNAGLATAFSILPAVALPLTKTLA